MNCKHPSFKYGVNALNELDDNGLITVFCLDCGEEFKMAVICRWGDDMGKMSQLNAMLNDGASTNQIADWIFSLKVQRGEDINEDTPKNCLETAKRFKREYEVKKNVWKRME